MTPHEINGAVADAVKMVWKGHDLVASVTEDGTPYFYYWSGEVYLSRGWHQWSPAENIKDAMGLLIHYRPEHTRWSVQNDCIWIAATSGKQNEVIPWTKEDQLPRAIAEAFLAATEASK